VIACHLSRNGLLHDYELLRSHLKKFLILPRINKKKNLLKPIYLEDEKYLLPAAVDFFL